MAGRLGKLVTFLLLQVTCLVYMTRACSMPADWTRQTLQEILAQGELVLYGTVTSRSTKPMGMGYPDYNVATLSVYCVMKNAANEQIHSVFEILEEDAAVCGSIMHLLQVNSTVIASLDGHQPAHINMQSSIFPATPHNLDQTMQICGFQQPSGGMCPNVVQSCVSPLTGAASAVWPSLILMLVTLSGYFLSTAH